MHLTPFNLQKSMFRNQFPIEWKCTISPRPHYCISFTSFWQMYSLTWEILGTLTVFRMNGLLFEADWPPPMGSKCLLLALINSLTATLWRKRSSVKMVSTADTPRVYFSMKVSPSGPVGSSWPEAAITAKDCRSSNSSLACNKPWLIISLSDPKQNK